MTNATSAALEHYWLGNSFTSFTLLSLIAVAVLALAIVEQEVLRSVQPESRARNARVLSIVIYPMSVLAISLIVTRFVHLA